MLEKPKKLNIKATKEMLNLKLCVIGDTQVGKSSIVNQYINGSYIDKYQPTIGIDYLNKIVE